MILHGDCLEKLKELEENSVDAIVTDPPYGLSFMGKKWDYDVPSKDVWIECLRVLKPGGYLLSFAGTRTQHRMAVNIEDAGFEIRDMIAWVYGSGFPKSLNIGKAVDKLQGNEREVVGTKKAGMGTGKSFGMLQSEGTNNDENTPREVVLDKGNSEWEGWGTALKPALEPITVARKPLSEKSVAENVLRWGTGGIDIDGCRVEYQSKDDMEIRKNTKRDNNVLGDKNFGGGKYSQPTEKGRFPANLIHDGSDEVVSLFPNTKSGALKPYKEKHINASSYSFEREKTFTQEANSGSAARFFYCAKASKAERNMGCEDMEDKAPAYESHRANYATTHGIETPYAGTGRSGKNFKNNHPTVKPIALMEYLVKLVSKEGAVVLDPFAGSGSTLIACKKLNRKYIGIEREEEYIKIIEARLSAVEPEKQQVLSF